MEWDGGGVHMCKLANLHAGGVGEAGGGLHAGWSTAACDTWGVSCARTLPLQPPLGHRRKSSPQQRIATGPRRQLHPWLLYHVQQVQQAVSLKDMPAAATAAATALVCCCGGGSRV